MSSIARASFVRSVYALRRAVAIDAVLTKNPPDPTHDDAAQLLRNGLAIVGFAALEGFIGKRCEELLAHVSNGHVAFADLPMGLQTAATENAMAVLSARIKQLRSAGQDPIPEVQTVASSIATTTSANLRMPSLALGWTGSNLNANDVKSILQRLGIGGDPWFHITEIAKRAGFNAQDLRTVFTDLMRQRHGAAHDTSYSATVVAVRSLPNSVLAIGFGFDALASRSAQLCSLGDTAFLQGDPQIHTNIEIRFLSDVEGCWKEHLETRPNRARKVSATRAEALAAALADTQAGDRAVIVERDQTGPLDWTCADLP